MYIIILYTHFYELFITLLNNLPPTITLYVATNRLDNTNEVKVKHACIVINTCYRVYAHQQNKLFESWDGVKYHQLTKYPKKRDYNKVL